MPSSRSCVITASELRSSAFALASCRDLAGLCSLQLEVMDGHAAAAEALAGSLWLPRTLELRFPLPADPALDRWHEALQRRYPRYESS